MSTVAEKLQRKSQRSAPVKQVRLKLVYIDFWSAVKLSFLVAICLSIALLITTLMIWVVLSSLGIINDVDALFAEILGEDALSLAEILSLGQVMFFASIVAVLNAVGGTVLGAVSALIYNLSVKLTGGLLVGFTNN
ncbi:MULTISPECIES: DUF3566 domain-containing protein [Microcella]|uniref:DUF3566 domain-containing protein n=1 Tax=Microcella TaxID=337004 RepID=UPI0015CF0129|nr:MULTISPECIES: DUF3566 domain-containing protein [Microcella]MBU1250995.1 DUF3566 domain-containing protein [Actinomycetota bacterium]MBU1609910.1 DUF3566 domain-containing protein [Actinomycetota bacterium]MBU2316430.1 DUF3566 domain-containing protein [Actinomycetota bacterium]MBU2384328.1 DUF3566 domain-containing protein [Actinomycetota bacterium]QOD93687.1 DUF3566 domain-containing protein [Chryseoglobus sp. 28M-23]